MLYEYMLSVGENRRGDSKENLRHSLQPKLMKALEILDYIDNEMLIDHE